MQNKDAFQAQVRSVAHKAAQAKGRKPKHKESASDDFMQTSKPASAMGLGRRYDDGKTFHEKWKKGENRSGSDREVLDMLTDMIGDDPMFKTSYDLNQK